MPARIEKDVGGYLLIYLGLNPFGIKVRKKKTKKNQKRSYIYRNLPACQDYEKDVGEYLLVYLGLNPFAPAD